VEVVLTEAIMNNFKAKLQPQTAFESVWDSRGSGVRKQASVWAPKVEKRGAYNSLSKKNKTRICLGHFVSEGFSHPKKADKVMCLEITDMNVSRLAHSDIIDNVVDRVLPPPVRYRQIWKQTSGKQQFFAWRPVPPTKDYVAVGIVGTTVDEPPELDAVRCVPRRWVRPTTAPAEQVWTNSGSGGRPGSFWIISPQMLLMSAVSGVDPPTDHCFELLSERWTLTMQDLEQGANAASASVAAGGSGGGAATAAAAGGRPRRGGDPPVRPAGPPGSHPARPAKPGKPPRPSRPQSRPVSMATPTVAAPAVAAAVAVPTAVAAVPMRPRADSKPGRPARPASKPALRPTPPPTSPKPTMTSATGSGDGGDGGDGGGSLVPGRSAPPRPGGDKPAVPGKPTVAVKPAVAAKVKLPPPSRPSANIQPAAATVPVGGSEVFQHQFDAASPWESYDAAANQHMSAAMASQGASGTVVLPGVPFEFRWGADAGASPTSMLQVNIKSGNSRIVRVKPAGAATRARAGADGGGGAGGGAGGGGVPAKVRGPPPPRKAPTRSAASSLAAGGPAQPARPAFRPARPTSKPVRPDKPGRPDRPPAKPGSDG
jgi:hypothetical protein